MRSLPLWTRPGKPPSDSHGRARTRMPAATVLMRLTWPCCSADALKDAWLGPSLVPPAARSEVRCKACLLGKADEVGHRAGLEVEPGTALVDGVVELTE